MKKSEKMKNASLLVMSCAVMVLASCSEKKETNTIIVPKKEQVVVSHEPQRMENVNTTKQVPWNNSTYTVIVDREADDSLGVISDADGRKYIDNHIIITVQRKDGSTFFHRTFTKNSFKECVPEGYLEHNALLGLVFTEAQSNTLKFAGSVGSPDQMSEEYIPVSLVINKMGDVTVQRDVEEEYVSTDPDARVQTGNSEPVGDVDDGV